MSGIFNPDNWFWRGFGRLADYFILSFCWLMCSVPLITVGTASIALYDAVAHCLRGNEGNMVKRFLTTFKNELGRGILLTLLWAIVCFVLNMGYQIITQMPGRFWEIFSVVYFATLFVPLGVICWLVATESRFANSFGGLHSTAIAFTFGYLPSTLAIVAVLVLVLNVVLNFPFFLIFLPAATAHLQSVFIERVFKKHMPVEGTDEIE